MTKAQKLEYLDDLFLDNIIKDMEADSVETKDLGTVATYLKNNKVVQERHEHDEAKEIEDLVDEVQIPS